MTTRPPVEYSEEITAIICEEIASGKSLRSICLKKGMPTKTSVFRWLKDNDAFRDQYARARDAQADTLFDEILDIANKPMIGKKTKLDADGKVIEMTKGDMIEHRRLMIDTRKWMAGKLRPKVYGDKLDVDLTGALDFVVSARAVSEEQWLKEHGSTS